QRLNSSEPDHLHEDRSLLWALILKETAPSAIEPSRRSEWPKLDASRSPSKGCGLTIRHGTVPPNLRNEDIRATRVPFGWTLQRQRRSVHPSCADGRGARSPDGDLHLVRDRIRYVDHQRDGVALGHALRNLDVDLVQPDQPGSQPGKQSARADGRRRIRITV